MKKFRSLSLVLSLFVVGCTQVRLNDSGTGTGTGNGTSQPVIVNVNNNPNINTNVNPNISNTSSNSSTTSNNNTNSQTNNPSSVASPNTAPSPASPSPSSSANSGSVSSTTQQNYKIIFVSGISQDIYLSNLDGSLKKKLLQGESNKYNSYPIASPDNSKIAFNSLYNLYVMNADGTGNMPIVKAELYGPSGTPSWTSDGKQLYFQDQNNIYVVNGDGTQKSLVYKPSSGINFSRISPDNKTLAFVSTSETLTTVGVNGVGETQITDNNKIKVNSRSNISWTPDGKSILFSGYLSENQSVNRNTDIYQVNTDGTGLKKLTDNAGRDDYPSLSPDGKLIVFESKRDEGEGIYTMTSDGKNQQIAIKDQYAIEPSFITVK